MAKALVGDKVAVLKKHDMTDTPFIALLGTLAREGRGLKTDDGRAKAEVGEVTPESEVDAPGWSIVKGEDGKEYSVPAKSVTLYSQKIVLKHNETMQQVAVVQQQMVKRTQQAADAKTRLEGLGVEVKSLSDDNALKIVELLG